jgi:pimeloyl-ACP methyl ester carboxylesterase
VPPETRYARSAGVNVAYQVTGSGPLDLLYVPGWVSHVEEAWEEPTYARFLSRLASFSRLILFDKRGTGMSDRVPDERLPSLEERLDDVRAVLDAVGSERAALLGFSEGGNLCALFGASHPERTTALVTFGIFAKRVWSPDYPWAPKPDEREVEIELVEQEWGKEMDISRLAPSAVHDQEFARRLITYLSRAASPGAARTLLRMNTLIDIREVLPSIRVPALVLHRRDDMEAKIEEGRWIAEQIPGARFVELAGADHLPWVGDQDEVLDEVEEFLTGVRRGPDPDRVLTTLVFTDVVGSTERAVEVGDAAWRALVDRHDALVRTELDRWRGQEIDHAGDGFFASFDGPARAIRFALAASQRVRELGLDVRAGVHTGECERTAEGLRGVAVHVAARIAALAGAGEVLVSQTVRDLVSGSGIEFEERGEHELKGLPERRALYGVLA